jgi:hypothetical protein
MRRYWISLLGLAAVIGLAIPSAAQASITTEHLAQASITVEHHTAGYERAFDHAPAGA